MQWFVYVAVFQVMALSQCQTVVMTVAVDQAVTMIARHDSPHFGLDFYLGWCVEDER